MAHVFRLNLDQGDNIPHWQWACLSEDEHSRADRLVTNTLRSRYVSAHAQMRQILAEFLATSPESIQFSNGEYGKPVLSEDLAMCFNLSHSAGLGLLAVSCRQQIGVDIEIPRENVDEENIARRFFAAHEVSAISTISSPTLRSQAFLFCWTRKEAYIKGQGMGLSIPLDSFAVSVAPGDPVLLFDRLPSLNTSQTWFIYNIDPGFRGSAALAVSGQLTAIHCWDWEI